MLKLKVLLFNIFLSFCSFSFAQNQHFHQSINSKALLVGNCQIELINQSGIELRVYGVFDDGSTLPTFIIDASDVSSHFISLFFYDYCHIGMEIYITGLDGFPVFSGFIRRNKPFILHPMDDATTISGNH